MDRKEKALAYIDLNGRGLEIGPSHSPLLPKSSGARVEIVDHAGRAELIEKYRIQGSPPDHLARIEDVDYVWTRGNLAELIGAPGAFDYIIGSHVIEHMVDLIGFLQDCEALLSEGGRLSLIVPDKRYCFDLFQPLTTVGRAVDGHEFGRPVHPIGTVVDHYAYACVRGSGVISWNSDTTAPIELQYDDIRRGSEDIECARQQNEYVDVHRWRFTPTSFRLLLQDLRDLGYHGLSEVGGFETAGNEFFITLARTKAPPLRHDRGTSLLQIEEELRSAVEPVIPAAELRRSEEAASSEAERLRTALAESERAAAAEISRLRAALAESERALAALSVCEQTLAETLKSKSWRITKPLREVAHGLRRDRS